MQVLVTGGIAYDKDFVKMIEDKVKFIAKVIVYPGEDERFGFSSRGIKRF